MRPIDSHEPLYNPNNKKTVRKVRLEKKVNQTIEKLKQYPAAKDVAKWAFILGLAGLTVLGVKGVKKISSAIHETRAKAENALKENQEDAFILFCQHQGSPALDFLLEQHDMYMQWTKHSIPEAISILARAGIVLDDKLEEIPPKDTIDRVLSYLNKEPVSEAEVKEAWKTIQEWKKGEGQWEEAERQFNVIRGLFKAGKEDVIKKMLKDTDTETTPKNSRHSHSPSMKDKA